MADNLINKAADSFLFDSADKELLNLIHNEKEIKKTLLENPAALKSLLQEIVIDDLKQALVTRKNALSYDYKNMKESFLSGLDSVHTRRAYAAALEGLEAFVFPDFERASFSDPETELSRKMFSLSAKTADSFIKNLSGRFSSSSVLTKAGGVSSFYSYVERITEGKIINSFRGSRVRPRLQYENKNKFYSFRNVTQATIEETEKDFQKIIDSVKAENKSFKAIIYIMLFRGLRAGSFERLQIDKNFFKTISKGKIYSGEFSPELSEKLSRLGVKKESFSSWTAERIENLFKYYSKKLYEKNLISFPYSCHDARHVYAIKNYLETKDIYKVSKLLNHNSVNITERYLKGLNIL